jgi:hypothetical protein
MAMEDDDFEDDEPSAEELSRIRLATPEDTEVVDALILGHCSHEWNKVAMVVGLSLDDFEARCPHLPYVYLQLRIAELVRQGRLEARGDVMAMRRSEVRRPVS